MCCGCTVNAEKKVVTVWTFSGLPTKNLWGVTVLLDGTAVLFSDVCWLPWALVQLWLDN